MSDLISVLIPSYGHEDYIEKCLISIIEQSYSNIEIVLVDDCSKDETFNRAIEILDRHKNRFHNVIAVKNIRNYGAPYTLNKCISLANGDYVAFCNSDDIFHPFRLALLYETVANSALGLAFSDVSIINCEDQECIGNKNSANIYFDSRHIDLNFPSVSWSFLNAQVATSTGNIFLTKKLLEMVGGFRDLKYCHDWDFFLRSMIHVEPIHVKNDLYKYRIHRSNSFHNLSDVAEQETIFCLRSYFRYVQNNTVNNKLAPSKANWPTTFEYYLARCSGKWVYNNLFNNYRNYYRTMDEIYKFDFKNIKFDDK
jgi:glycosyltransferase involved in cell wall biosynthesis